MNLGDSVKAAAAANNIFGVMKLMNHCGLSFERTRRVWDGHTTAKIQDVMTIMSSLGYAVSFNKVENDDNDD